MKNKSRSTRQKLSFIFVVLLAVLSAISCLPVSQNSLPGTASVSDTAPVTPSGIALSLPPGGKSLAGFRIIPIEIPVSDGAKLAADLYIPESGGPFPIILIQTPYNKALHNPNLVQEMSGGHPTRSNFIESTDYAVVAADWRGRFGSKNAGGTTGASVGTTEQRKQDGYDTVEWISQQPWCNGKVGTWGSSALGNIQYETASKQPPHLVCIMPRVSDFSNGYDKYYYGGTMRKEYLDGLRAATWGSLADTVAARPLNDGFYDGKDYADPKDIKAPMLIVGGWFDIHNITQVYNSFLQGSDLSVSRNFRLLICPSSHGNIAQDGPEGELEFPGAGDYARNEQKKFFDYWLKGADNGFKNALPVTYYQMGSNEWRFARQWPPAGTKNVNYYLQEEGMLTTNLPLVNASSKRFAFDPKDPVPTVGGNTFGPGLIRGPADQAKKVESHKDALIFQSGVLEKDVTVAGDIEVKLFVSSDAVDTDAAVRITDVYPDGRSMLVRDGIQRLSHLDSDREEKFINPDTIYPVTVKTYSVAQTFLKGHRIKLVVSASNYPRYGINNGSQDRTAPPKLITNTLYLGKDYPSAVLLPVMGN